MGIDVEGKLMFGFAWPDDDDTKTLQDLYDEVGVDYFDDLLVFKYFGKKGPTEEYIENQNLYSKWWDEKRELEKDIPFDITWGGSGQNEPVNLIYIKGTLNSCDWGETIVLTPAMLDTDPTWDDKFKELFEKLGVPYIEPHWIMAAYMG